MQFLLSPTHIRLLICACLADRKTRLKIENVSNDILATIDCLTSMGAEIKKQGDIYEIAPISFCHLKTS